MNSEDEIQRAFWPRFCIALVFTVAGLVVIIQMRYAGLVLSNIPFVILTFFVAGAAWVGTVRQLLEDELARLAVENYMAGMEEPW